VQPADRFNADLVGYVCTFPVAERLREHLASQGRAGEFPSVQATLDAVVSDVGDYLYALAAPIAWGPEFERALFRHLVVRHVWLTLEGFAPLKGYAGWFSWHEGLNAP
jgi:hypothetical protein